ncbi:MAG: YfhO family protein [Candidatus Omnitrophota bacterium]
MRAKRPGGISPGLKAGLFILSASAVSLLVLAVTFPELMVYRNRSFMFQHDMGIPFENVFTLVSHYFHGGIQLWDRYDQMSYVYSHLSSGLYTLANLFTAGCYILLSPLFRYPAQAFHSVHAICFYGVTVLIRTLGGYCLLKKFVRDPVVIFISLLYLNTFLASTQYCVLTANLYSYLPFVLYFLVGFFQDFRLKDFLGFLLLTTITVAASPLLALGYFYQVVHFFIVASLIVSALSGGWTRFVARFRKGRTGRNFLFVVFALMLCGIMLLPIFRMADVLTRDFYLPGSGLGATEGRIKNMFSVSKYFQVGNSSYSQGNLWIRSLDFKHNLWRDGWPFIGATALLLSALGLCFSRDNRKYIFLGTIILIVLVNYPRNMASFTSLSHWINALTNPFAFLLRSFHMPALLWPVFLLPLIAWGLEGIKEWVFGPMSLVADKPREASWAAAQGVVLAFILISSWTLSFPVQAYALFPAWVFLVLLYAGWKRGSWPPLWEELLGRYGAATAGMLLILVFGVDLMAFSIFIRHDDYSRWDLKPRSYSGLKDSQPFILDFQNPRILPLRAYFRADDQKIDPRLYTAQNHYGLFYQFVAMDRPMAPANIYTPVHIGYKDLSEDEDAKSYLRRNPGTISWAAAALPQTQATLGELVKSNMDHHVILIDENKGLPAELPVIQNDVPSLIPEEGQPVVAARKEVLEMPFAQAVKRIDSNGLAEYAFPLPEEFPSSISTTVFSGDRDNTVLSSGERVFKPVQGHLLWPFTFDINNVRNGYLALLLPQDFPVAGATIRLEFSRPAGVQEVWRNEHDHLGLSVRLNRDGWMVFHYPYDEKWRLTVDQKKSPLWRVNKYFIGTPLAKGDHQILLEYWPRTQLRFMIKMSILTVMMSFGLLVIYALRQTSGERPKRERDRVHV